MELLTAIALGILFGCLLGILDCVYQMIRLMRVSAAMDEALDLQYHRAMKAIAAGDLETNYQLLDVDASFAHAWKLRNRWSWNLRASMLNEDGSKVFG